MAEAVPNRDDKVLQHFLTNSPLDEQQVVEHVTHDANALFGGYADSCLILGESSMPKESKKSVGVSMQWCGQLGKKDNCQVGVYSILCRGEHSVPISFRLFLPQCWVDYASPRLLGSTQLPGCEESMWHGRTPRSQVARLTPSHGNSNDGHAIYGEAAYIVQRYLPATQLLLHRLHSEFLAYSKSHYA